jgi:tRNA(fMet)-specific endonuclease VapC
MTVYLLDTNHVSAMLKRNPTFVQNMKAKAGGGNLCVSIPSIAELWFMVFNSVKQEANADDLNAVLDGLDRCDFSEDAAKEFGRIKAELRRKGRPIPDADVQIAAIAKFNNLTVLTADAHFNNISDLRKENWLI